MTTPLQTAAAAVVAHLAAEMADVHVTGDDVPELAQSTALVRCTGSEWALHRTHVAIRVEIWATTGDPRRAVAERRRIGDAVLSAVQTLSGDVWWAGAGSDLVSELDDDGQTIDGIPWASGAVECTVVVDHPIAEPAEPGTPRRRVETILAAAGLPVVDTADRGLAVMVRRTGTAGDDQRLARCTVWAIAPADEGTIDALAAACWTALFGAGEVNVHGWTVELSSTGAPGTALVHDIAVLDVTVLPD